MTFLMTLLLRTTMFTINPTELSTICNCCGANWSPKGIYFKGIQVLPGKQGEEGVKSFQFWEGDRAQQKTIKHIETRNGPITVVYSEYV